MPSQPTPGTERASAQRAAELWEVFSGQVGRLHDIVMADLPAGDPAVADLSAAEGVRYLLRYLAAGITTCIEFDDTVHPELGTLIENRRSWGLDNPDTKYSFTRIEPGATYILDGDPGTACELEIQVDTGHFADGRFSEWRSLKRWRRGASTMPLDEAGGSITFKAPPESSYLHVREYFADWDTERPALLNITREGAPLPPEPLDLRTVAQRMELLGLWLTAGARCWADLGRGLAAGEPGPVVPFVPPDTATGLGGQAYGMGAYRCGPADAVVLELVPPPCRYWSVSLATWFWESTDLANRQCSLNHTQAKPDGDGVVRFVLSQSDPGVANWLDAAGHHRGTLALRLLDADPGELPVLSYRTVALDQLAAELPGDVRHVSPGERAENLARRRDAVVRRYRR